MSHSTVVSHQLTPGETAVYIVVRHNGIKTYEEVREHSGEIQHLLREDASP